MERLVFNTAEHKFEELWNYGFESFTRKEKTHKYECENGEKDYYTEYGYHYDDGTNYMEIVTERINSDWNHHNSINQVYVNESNYEMGVSQNMLVLLYDLIKDGLVIKEKQDDKN